MAKKLEPVDSEQVKALGGDCALFDRSNKWWLSLARQASVLFLVLAFLISAIGAAAARESKRGLLRTFGTGEISRHVANLGAFPCFMENAFIQSILIPRDGNNEEFYLPVSNLTHLVGRELTGASKADLFAPQKTFRFSPSKEGEESKSNRGHGDEVIREFVEAGRYVPTASPYWPLFYLVPSLLCWVLGDVLFKGLPASANETMPRHALISVCALGLRLLALTLLFCIPFSASANSFTKNVGIVPVIIPELKFRNVERKVFAADLVIGANDPALDEAPESFNRVRVDSTERHAYRRLRATVACNA